MTEITWPLILVKLVIFFILLLFFRLWLFFFFSTTFWFVVFCKCSGMRDTTKFTLNLYILTQTIMKFTRIFYYFFTSQRAGNAQFHLWTSFAMFFNIAIIHLFIAYAGYDQAVHLIFQFSMHFEKDGIIMVASRTLMMSSGQPILQTAIAKSVLTFFTIFWFI